MNRIEKAVNDLTKYNCCQATLSAFAKELGLDMETVLKISSGFGGGMCKSEVCGIVSGAIMAIGLKHGTTETKQENSVPHVKELITKFMDSFIAKHGTCTCKGLLGFDKSTKEGAKIDKEQGVSAKLCPEFLKSGIELAEALL